jgi:hypothetical protein
MTHRRRRVRVSVDGRPIDVWEGTSVLETVEAVVPGVLRAMTAGRKAIVDASGGRVDPERDAGDGEALFVVAVPHPGTKPI